MDMWVQENPFRALNRRHSAPSRFVQQEHWTGPKQSDRFIPLHRTKQRQGARVSKSRFGFNHDASVIKLRRWAWGYDANPNYVHNTVFQGIGNAHWKRWLLASPNVLRMSLEDSLRCFETLYGRSIPDYNPTPDYGQHWAREAVYFELIPRLAGKVTHHGQQFRDGILSAMKLLLTIPASQNGIAHCVVLAGVLPTIGGDGWVANQSSLYTADLRPNSFSQYLFPDYAERNGTWMTQADWLRAFNDLAHLRGLKTGFFLPISEGQLRRNGNYFSWGEHRADYWNMIRYCSEDLGFDAVYFDSGKHVGYHDMSRYGGAGAPPEYHVMQEVTYGARTARRPDFSFIGEYCEPDYRRYQPLGFNAGLNSYDFSGDGIYHACQHQRDWSDYASGLCVSDDNDHGCHSDSENDRRAYLDTYYHRVAQGLFQPKGLRRIPMRLPMHVWMPLAWGKGIHDQMENCRNYSGYGRDHWDNTFATDRVAQEYLHKLNERFAWAAAY